MSHDPPSSQAAADATEQSSVAKPITSHGTADQPNGTGMFIAHVYQSLHQPKPEPVADVCLASNASNATEIPPRAASTTEESQTASVPIDGGEGASTAGGEPKKKRSFLNIPRSNSQSNEEQTPTGTGLSGATVTDSESVGRGSKRSFLGKRRAGSTTSSRRSHHATASEKVEQPPLPPSENREGSTRSKARKSGGLLSCLPCFAPKESHQSGEETPTENVKRVEKVQPGRTTQSPPVSKVENTAESSTADSKEPLDEKAGSEAFSVEREGDGTTERPSNDAAPKIVTRTPSKKQTEQPLPPLPNQPGTLQTGHPQINIQSPTPGTTPVQPRPSHEQQQIIHDRTESQEEKDQDIEMNDVPLASTEVRHEGDDASDESQNEIPPKVDLPPPPPLEQRQIAVHDQISQSSISEQPQKYLLGPIRPEFKGKKCLVLDLDETLVHSSFKVSFASNGHHGWITKSTLDSCTGRFYHPCRD